MSKIIPFVSTDALSLEPRVLDDRPIFDTTLYLATCPLDTRQHSSCVRNETLRGCDCVQKFERAFKIIAVKGNGILFYLMQEGRGDGFQSKAYDRMLVQASLDQISTFQAYASMGRKKDHHI